MGSCFKTNIHSKTTTLEGDFMRILIHSNRKELDRNLDPVDYEELPALKRKWGGNLGNKLFLTSMDVYCHMDGIEYEYLTSDMTADYINSNFNLILWPLANCFAASKEIMGYLEDYIIKLNQYKIPVLALGAGAQAASYDDLDALVGAIKPTATAFINAVHKTGGVFGLRGYFTKELFEHLGFKEDYVTGCPSMYQMGRDLHIEKMDFQDDFNIAINGDKTSMKNYRKNNFLKKYPNLYFVDQGEYVLPLYDYQTITGSIKGIRTMMEKYSRMGVEMLANEKIICIYDLPRLAQYLKDLKINVSFGQRIHGNILCTLLEIPAIVYIHDSRTKELADYFEIPTCTSKHGRVDIREAYEKASWNDFNKNFGEKYDQFEKLLMKYGMPAISSNKYTFLKDLEQYKMPMYVNDYSKLQKLLSKKLFWIGKR